MGGSGGGWEEGTSAAESEKERGLSELLRAVCLPVAGRKPVSW